MWCQFIKKRFCTQFSNWFSRITLHYCYWKLCYTGGITHRLLVATLIFLNIVSELWEYPFLRITLHWNIKWSQKLSLIFGRQNWLIYIYILSISYFRSQMLSGTATLFECFFSLSILKKKISGHDINKTLLGSDWVIRKRETEANKNPTESKENGAREQLEDLS